MHGKGAICVEMVFEDGRVRGWNKQDRCGGRLHVTFWI